MEKAAKFLGIDKDIPSAVRNVLLLLAGALSIAFTAGGFFSKAQAVPLKIKDIECAIEQVKVEQVEQRSKIKDSETQQSLTNERLKAILDKMDAQTAEMKEQRSDIRDLRQFVMEKK